jgi:arsenite methyltransferase
MSNFREYYRKVAQGGRSSGAVVHSDPVAQALAIGYSRKELQNVPAEAVMGTGCGNPTALAELREGQTVLDVGCGGGLDAFLAAGKVGPKGRVIGIDMTGQMVARARAAAAKGGYRNVEFLTADMAKMPVKENSVDAVISNCVMNHARDKVKAFREALRCLKAGGLLLVSDLIVQGEFGPDALNDEVWGAWLANALGKQEYLDAIAAAGFRNITVMTETPFKLAEGDAGLKGKIVSINVKAYK